MERPEPRGWSIRLAADPAGVPGARRFVVEGLTAWGRTALVDAAELVVSELAGNAALHSGARFMDISLEALEERGVRVAVEDDGEVVSEAVASPPTLGGLEKATTGRGLAIVSMLSVDWGVGPTARGKRVWADVVDSDADNAVRPPRRTGPEATARGAPEMPPGWVLVRLADCPVELSLQQDQHLDELVRELQLVSADRDSRTSRAIAAQISDLLDSPAHARVTGRRIAEQARSRGLEHTDIDLAMPREISVAVQRLDDAVKRADELCEQDRLLALASSPALRELRAWMTHEIVAQVDRGEPPVPWAEWVGRHRAANG